MTSDEFSPREYFSRIMRLWWVVLLATVLGGTLGFIFFHLHQPIYEATATYFVTLDLNRFPLKSTKEDLIQYNEDMALNTTEGALLSTNVLNNLIAEEKKVGKTLTQDDILQNYTIERKHDVWELRYRSSDPSEAMEIVNTWANLGYQEMITWQATGKAPAYVIFQPPRPALQPKQPVLYGRNKLIIAGALIGFIIGIIISALLGRIPEKTIQE